MPLYIRDDEVDRLAVELQEMTKAPTKTEAVREALKEQIARKRAEIPLGERIKAIQERAKRELGPFDHSVDMKALMDEMWGDI